MYTGELAMEKLTAFQSSQDTLYALAYTTLYRNRARVFETAPIAIGGGSDASSNALPLRLSLSLSSLEQGEYSLQVTVLDPTGRKAAFWQAPVMVVP
jgi:hypothetical protein